MSSYLITGSSRGLGLELVRQLSLKPSSEVSTIFAATRSPQPTPALQSLIDSSSSPSSNNNNSRIVHVFLAPTEKPKSVAAAVKHVEEVLAARGESQGLDVLINNAAIMPITPDGISTMEGLQEAFQVNVETVHDVTKAFLGLLRRGRGRKVLNMSTTVGSMAYTPRYSWAPTPAYKITKAAMNMLTIQYALEFEKEGFAFFMVSPGWLKTDMGSQNADLDVDVGAKATLDILARDVKDLNGKFCNVLVPGWEKVEEGPNQYDGEEVPW